MKGFTIVELIISIGIVSIIFSIGLASYRSSSSQYAEVRSAQTIAQVFREAQNMALSGLALNCTGNPADKPCAYGVYVDKSPSRILIFGDGVNGGPKNKKFNSGEDLKSFELEGEIVITDILIGNSSKNDANILFAPPNPLISFHPTPGTSVRVVITGGRSITITSGGSVDVD